MKMQNYTPQILIVDDELIIRHVLRATLEIEGYQIADAESGEAALALLEKQNFDVVITDITMGKVSGIDLLFAVKEKSPETEVILITAYASLETAEAAVAGKACRYLRKPFDDIEDVIKIVEEALLSQKQQRKQQQELQDLTLQRDRLQQRIGQLETMYSISHALGFPESPLTLLRELAPLLSQALPADFMAYSIHGESMLEFAGIFVALLSPFQEEMIQQYIHTLHQETGAQGNIHVENTPMRSGNEIGQLAQLIEIAFPERSVVEGALYVGFAEERKISEDEAQLLEVTAAQLAGAIGKLMEFQCRERERLQLLTEDVVLDGVILFKQKQEISIANQAAFDMLAVTNLEELSERLQQLGILTKLHQTREEWALGKELTLESGRVIAVTIVPLGSLWEAASTVILRDVTQQHKMQEELERSRRLSAIGELGAGVVHELNTPLTLIMGHSQLILTDDTLSAEVKADLHKILEESQRCQKIVQSLLELAPSRKKRRTKIQVKDIMEKVLLLKKYDLNKSHTKLDLQYLDPDILVDVDPGQIHQVILNLINNAQDAMREQQQPCKIEISIERRQDIAWITIADNGPGISEKDIGQIFDPFFTTKPPGKGSGLGLSISYKIIREHAGRIVCTNRKKAGASFTIELPIVK